MTLASRGALGVVSAGVPRSFDAGAPGPACAASPELERCAERIDMPVIKINDQQFSLRRGPNRLGGGADADVCVDDDATLGVQAIVDVAGDDAAVIRRAEGTGRPIVRVNGIPLVDPTPLMHGDKVEIAGTELLYAEDAKAGATQYVSAAAIAAMAQRRPGSGRATTATGGRLVSLVDGKEYAIPESGVLIGRDPGAEVVVAQNEVSRKHAEVVPVEMGYVVRDLSANGVFVNGARVDRSQLLARSDVIRVGSEEFRFYANVAPAAVAEAEPAAAAAPTPPLAASAADAQPPAAVRAPTTAAAPTEPARPAVTRPVLAWLEIINEGPDKGRRIDIHVPLAHVGRGAHNDVVVSDDSVSDTHAKLQRRDDGWYLIDLGSTNGTYVGGHRLVAERRLDGTPDVRFGGVKLIFRAEGAAAASTGTRAIVNVDRSKVKAGAPSASRTPAPAADTARRIPGWLWIVVVLAVAAAVLLFMINR
jgi:pSer/pThr/pTyr-binding forkhead associated (FHA) protein